jgi:arylsulfatase A-like enzyme
MAAEGLKLTNFYSVAPVCTPSRCRLMTVAYAARMGIQQMHLSNVLTFQDKTGLPNDETTVANSFERRGYSDGLHRANGIWAISHRIARWITASITTSASRTATTCSLRS